MRCAAFVHVGGRTSWFGKHLEACLDWLAGLYSRTLRVALDFRWLVPVLDCCMFRHQYPLFPNQ